MDPEVSQAAAIDDGSPPSPCRRWALPRRPTAVEWCLLLAFGFALVGTWPFSGLGGIAFNQRAAGAHCRVLYHAELALRRVLRDGRPHPYATPRELAGAAPGPGGTRYSLLADDWAALDAAGTATTAFGYRAAFFIDEAREHWALVLWPARWGVDGEIMVAVTQGGRIHRYAPPAAARPATREEAAVAAWGDPARAASPANAAWRPGWTAVD